jgi:hypothetical protein
MFLVRRAQEGILWQQWMPIGCAISILIVCMSASLNSGLRYLLPIYPMLAIMAGFGASSLISLTRSNRIGTGIAVVLLVWHGVSSAAAHPDYLAYSNELAGSKPERILVDSDLDWGQDLNRLREKLQELRVPEVALAYFGTADLDRHGLPKVRQLVPYQPTTGWVAISVYELQNRAARLQKRTSNPSSPWAWLERYEPAVKVGKSMRPYYIPPASAVVSAEQK